MFKFNKSKKDKKDSKQSIIDEVLMSQTTLFETALNFTGEIDCEKLNNTLNNYLDAAYQL